MKIFKKRPFGSRWDVYKKLENRKKVYIEGKKLINKGLKVYYQKIGKIGDDLPYQIWIEKSTKI